MGKGLSSTYAKNSQLNINMSIMGAHLCALFENVQLGPHGLKPMKTISLPFYKRELSLLTLPGELAVLSVSLSLTHQP
jgi:hypothetical protein